MCVHVRLFPKTSPECTEKWNRAGNWTWKKKRKKTNFVIVNNNKHRQRKQQQQQQIRTQQIQMRKHQNKNLPFLVLQKLHNNTVGVVLFFLFVSILSAIFAHFLFPSPSLQLYSLATALPTYTNSRKEFWKKERARAAYSSVRHYEYIFKAPLTQQAKWVLLFERLCVLGVQKKINRLEFFLCEELFFANLIVEWFQSQSIIDRFEMG